MREWRKRRLSRLRAFRALNARLKAFGLPLEENREPLEGVQHMGMSGF